MSDTEQDQQEPVTPSGETTEPGFLHIEEEEQAETTSRTTSAPEKSAPLPPPQGQERAGTVEHLAARRPVPELDKEAPEIKQRLSALRAECTRLVTGLRWEGVGVEETADRMIPLLNVGPVEQWKATLIPFLYEIDRGGALIPVWLDIIARGDPPDLPADANPAETMAGRARRFAILMLGNYRMMGIAGLGSSPRPATLRRENNPRGERDLTQVLGDLAIDPNTSLYATQSLVKHATVPAIQELVRALKYARGWAKVDVVNGCLELKQEEFYDLLVASGLDDAPGLESYLATPIYRVIPLENFLNGDEKTSPRLSQQAALIFAQVLQDSLTSSGAGTATDALPIVFERHLPTVARALFAGAQRKPAWQNVIALHRLGLLLGRYWSEISQGKLKDGRIIEPVYHCLPMMNDVEYWMQNVGREVLLKALEEAPEKDLTPIIKVLGDMRDPRASTPLMVRLSVPGAAIICPSTIPMFPPASSMRQWCVPVDSSLIEARWNSSTPQPPILIPMCAARHWKRSNASIRAAKTHAAAARRATLCTTHANR